MDLGQSTWMRDAISLLEQNDVDGMFQDINAAYARASVAFDTIHRAIDGVEPAPNPDLENERLQHDAEYKDAYDELSLRYDNMRQVRGQLDDIRNRQLNYYASEKDQVLADLKKLVNDTSDYRQRLNSFEDFLNPTMEHPYDADPALKYPYNSLSRDDKIKYFHQFIQGLESSERDAWSKFEEWKSL